MEINRDENQGGLETAIDRVSFCLNQLEKAEDFNGEIGWHTDIVSMLTIEEMVGALVIAEQQLKDLEEKLRDIHELSDLSD